MDLVCASVPTCLESRTPARFLVLVFLLRTPCKISEPYDNSFWEKSNNLGRRKKKNAVNSGPIKDGVAISYYVRQVYLWRGSWYWLDFLGQSGQQGQEIVKVTGNSSMTVRKVDNIKIIKISNYSNFIPAEILYFALGYQILLLKDLTPEV